MNKMIVNHLDKLFVTNDAATIIKELEVGAGVWPLRQTPTSPPRNGPVLTAPPARAPLPALAFPAG